jgi:hypothetical protein
MIGPPGSCLHCAAADGRDSEVAVTRIRVSLPNCSRSIPELDWAGKRRARGYRRPSTFKTVILLVVGKLNFTAICLE